jgi:hypothetical protein
MILWFGYLSNKGAIIVKKWYDDNNTVINPHKTKVLGLVECDTIKEAKEIFKKQLQEEK